jgi:2-desacetyl-2-hydroxyethyl bacteriochlorophyllide A dehydrogenase
MRALIYEAPEVMMLREVEAPAVADHEVLVRVAYSGICGSELSGFLGKNSLRQPPLVFGHEFSGWIEAVGERVPDELGLGVGQQVTANPFSTCGRCDYCRRGRNQLCQRRQLLGAHVAGCNAEYVAVSADQVRVLPPGMDLALAATAEPAACAIRAVAVSGAVASSSALVVGAGPIGLFILQVLRELGVRRRYVAELQPERLALAVADGALPVVPEEGPTGFRIPDDHRVDVAFDAVGSATTRQACVRHVAPAGTVVLVGLHTDATPLPFNEVVRAELSIVGAFAFTPVEFDRAVDWLATGRLGLNDGVVHAPLDEGPDWYPRLVAGHRASKVLLMPGEV